MKMKNAQIISISFMFLFAISMIILRTCSNNNHEPQKEYFTLDDLKQYYRKYNYLATSEQYRAMIRQIIINEYRDLNIENLDLELKKFIIEVSGKWR